MLRWPHLVIVGVLVFAVVTLHVATLELTLSTLRTLSYVAIGAYGVGLLGLAAAFPRIGTGGRLLGALVFGLATGGMILLAILPRLTVVDLIPFLP